MTFRARSICYFVKIYCY